MVRIRIFAAAVAATLAPSLALAEASAPPSRADVKGETRAAEKPHTLTPAGEAERPTTGTPGKGSTTTRAERKAATVEARKKHQLAPALSTPDYYNASHH